MNSSRMKIVTLAIFVLTLVAGMTAGILAARLPRVQQPTNPAGVSSPLAVELGLSDEQSRQMQAIWEQVRDLSLESENKALSANDARMAEIQNLIPADKIDQYKQVQQNYDAKVAGLKARRQAAFSQAVEKTRGILNPDQQRKYNEILKSRLGTDEIDRHDPLAVPAAAGGPATQPVLR